MTSCNVYSLKWLQACLVMGLLSLMLPAQAATEAALVLFSHGNVVLTNNSGSYLLEKGGFVSAGDTVITGDDGRVQLRFTDGGLVSLMPNSRFAVEEYSQPTEDAEGSVSVNLIKGGLRALSGSIGKKDKDSYKLKTDVATLGIRGTQFVVVMDGAIMRVHVGQGRVALFDAVGQLLVPTGKYAEVFPGKAPSLSKVPAVFLSSPQPNSQSEEEQSEEEQGEGNQSQEKQNEGSQSQGKQSEANQGSEAASTSAEVARTLEPGVSQGEEAGKVRLEDKDGNTQTLDISKNTNKPDNQTPPVVPDPVAPDPVVPDPVVPEPIDPTPDSGKVEFYGVKSSTKLDDQVPGIRRTEFTQNEYDIAISENGTEDFGGLHWREDTSMSVSDPSETVYTTSIWGPSMYKPSGSLLPPTGTLNYSLAPGGASPVRSGSDQHELTEFNLQIELIGQPDYANMKVDFEFGDGLKVEQKAFEYATLNTATGAFNFNFNENHNADGNRQLTYSRGGTTEDCTDCVLSVVGFLSGEQAEQAGIAYNLNIGQTPDTYNDAAILNKNP